MGSITMERHISSIDYLNFDRPDIGKGAIVYDIFNKTNDLLKSYGLAKKLSREDVDAILDPFVRNYVLNIWEAANRIEKLDSFPFNVSIPIADLCNARCSFCDSWLRGKAVLTPKDLEIFVPILRTARVFGVQGHGEPLVNPNISKILGRIGEVAHPTSNGFLITNGIYLKKYLDECLRANITSFNISLNAGSEAVHERVMGLGPTFGQIIESILTIKGVAKNQASRDTKVNLSFVLTSENIEDLPTFLKLSRKCAVDKIFLRTLLPLNPHPDFATAKDWKTYFDTPNSNGLFPEPAFQPGLNYHLLHPARNPNFKQIKKEALKLIGGLSCEVEAAPDTWDIEILPKSMRDFLSAYPEKLKKYDKSDALKSSAIRNYYKDMESSISGNGHFQEKKGFDGENPLDRQSPWKCGFVYHNLIVNETNKRMVPCCNMADVPGFEPIVLDKDMQFSSAWNSEAMVRLRQTLSKGPLFDACKVCSIQGF